MMKKFIYGVLVFSPMLALAANVTGLTEIVTFIANTVSSLIPIMFGLAIIYFFWGLTKYIRSAGDPKGAAEGKSIMIYGVIAIAIMASIYGLVNYLQDLFGISATGTIQVPTVTGLP